MANWTKKRSSSKLISLLRQAVVSEYDGSKLYSYLPSLNDVCSVEAMQAVLGSHCKSEDLKAFYDLYQSEGSNYAFPFAGTIHNYLKKHDKEWYYSQEAFKE